MESKEEETDKKQRCARGGDIVADGEDDDWDDDECAFHSRCDQMRLVRKKKWVFYKGRWAR